MIIVVTGSRSLREHPDRLAIKDRFLRAIDELNPTQLHDGGAAGPDTWAHIAFHNVSILHAPAKTLGRTPSQRLYDRNITMIDAALAQGKPTMVTCWDGKSNGTRHAIDYAMSEGITMVHTHEAP